MRRWFLSYNSQELRLVQAFQTALRRKDADAHIFFAPKNLRAGGYWLPELAKEIAESTTFVLLVGEKGLGPWQVAEYYEAIDRRVKEQNFPVVLVLLDGQPAPGLPFLRQLHWIVTPDPASEQNLAKLMDAAAGAGTRPDDLWRYTAPYRGLAAMTEADGDFFFGRTRETVEVIRTLEATPDKLPVLLGNSGVGKSSLAQAGVLAALARQDWPEDAANAGRWPQVFHNSRRWCFLTVRPGVEPLKALVEPFLRTWQLDATDPLWAKRQAEWIEGLLDGTLTLRDLLDATERRYIELSQSKAPCFFLYVDQGEELYVRSEERQRRRFSEILAHALGDPRLRALATLRADFFGELQKDEPLYAVHRQINVPPLREAELRDVVSKPAALLLARFETDGLAVDIARRTAEESTKDAGALPLLSYLLDDMWTRMVQRGDGVLRLPAQAMELGGVLAERANTFLLSHPEATDALRRVMTLKLATVREDGEPTRRRARRSEFTNREWSLISELADHPNRLLVTATPEGGEPYAEVAHEAIFRRWEELHKWIAEQREFLIWKSGLEGDRRRWEAAPNSAKSDALLMGLALTHAQSWLPKRAKDLPKSDRDFIELSLERESYERIRAEQVRRRFSLGITTAAIFNGIVTIILAIVIWAGTAVLRTSWDDMRQIRENDKLLVLLESEANRLQNLIHRYINQPSQDVLAEILGLHDEVVSTLRNRSAGDPVFSSSADELRAVTERFLQGFGEVREVQSTIASTYENEVLKPAKEMAGLYAIIEGAIGRRDALLLPSLGKSREAFTASLVAANAFYLSLASDAADEARRNIATVEQTIPAMIDLAENSLQRTALTALAQRAASFRDGLKTLAEQFVARTNLLKTAIDDPQAAMIAVINKLSGQMTLREFESEKDFTQILADVYQRLALISIVSVVLVVCVGLYLARSVRLISRKSKGEVNAKLLSARQIQAENARLKKLLAERDLEIDGMKQASAEQC